MTRVAATRLAALALLLLSCDSSFFLRGTVGGDCDPPRSIIPATGGSDVDTLRKSNCQPMDTVCCRTSAKAGRTSCQYPEDCFVAPYQGTCATAVDCSNTQECTGGTCQCTLGGPACADPTTHVVTCCTAVQVCNGGSCGDPLDAGT
jgi:hypothetical protein